MAIASKISGYIGQINPGNGTTYSIGSTAYAECDTAAATAQKDINMTGFDIKVGATIFVKFTNGNTNLNPVLKINNTGTAVPIIVTSGFSDDPLIPENTILCLTYDGSSWRATYQNDLSVLNNQEPYLYRTTGGNTDVKTINASVKKIDKIIGATVGWNQCMSNGDFSDGTTGFNFYRGTASVESDGSILFTMNGDYPVITNNNVRFTAGHVILTIIVTKRNITDTCEQWIYYPGSGVQNPIKSNNYSDNTNKNTWASIIKLSTASNTIRFEYYPCRQVTSGSVNIYSIACIDLTQMFGSTIADYINTLETTETGRGLAWIKSYGFFDKDYYPYNPGSLESVKISGIRNTGFNQWDEKREQGGLDTTTGDRVTNYYAFRNINIIQVLPNTEYYLKRDDGASAVFFYDNNQNYISCQNLSASGTFTTPVNCHYLNLLGWSPWSPDENMCLNISDSSRNGDYEPYDTHQYLINNDLELRGLLKLDNNNNLYYDGDTWFREGQLERNYAVFISNENTNWNMVDTSYIGETYSRVYTVTGTRRYVAWTICQSFVLDFAWEANSALDHEHYFYDSLNITQVIVANSKTGITTSDTREQAIAKMKAYFTAHPFVMVYLKQLPTMENAPGYQSIEACSPYGTEEFIDNRTYPVPVGHETYYRNNTYLWDGIDSYKTRQNVIDSGVEVTNQFISRIKQNANGELEIYKSDLDASGYLPLTGGSVSGEVSISPRLGVGISANANYTLYVNGPAKFTNSINATGFAINTTTGTGNGISLYSGEGQTDTYGIHFSKITSFGKYGDVQSDWATYFTMNDNSQRGWIWKATGSAVAQKTASLSSRGVFTVPAVGAAANYIAYPQGGQYNYTDGSITGAIKITLPVSGNSINTMINFTVVIDTYNSAQTIAEYHIYGFCYSSSGWHANECKAYVSGMGSRANLPIRWCSDGSNACVVIGNTDTTWSYPHVYIKDVCLGHSNNNIQTWGYGWSVGIITTLPDTIVTSAATANTQNINITGSAASCTGNAATATALTSNAGSATQPIYFTGGKPSACSYNLQANVIYQTHNATTGFWSAAYGLQSGPILNVIRHNATVPTYIPGSYASTLVYGGADTKGMLSIGYSVPIITFGGGSTSNSTANDPAWWIKLTGTTGTTYNLNNVGKTGSIDNAAEMYIIGATLQANAVTTYSKSAVRMTSANCIIAASFQATNGTNGCEMIYDANSKSIKFVFS